MTGEIANLCRFALERLGLTGQKCDKFFAPARVTGKNSCLHSQFVEEASGN